MKIETAQEASAAIDALAKFLEGTHNLITVAWINSASHLRQRTRVEFDTFTPLKAKRTIKITEDFNRCLWLEISDEDSLLQIVALPPNFRHLLNIHNVGT